MTSLVEHLLIVPIVLPLFVGAALLFIDERRRGLKATTNVGSTVALAVVAFALLNLAGSQTGVYRLGGWPTPVGIVLVVDRLAAVMLVLTSLLALASVVFSLARWHRAGRHFHSLFQFLLMGLNGAFLTGDLFNLFVFFEVLLAASYGLALHGSGVARVKAGLHYIAVNLAGSLLFLIGVSLIYGVTGTLNMADLATRIPQVSADDRMLLEAGAAVLGVALLLKAGIWPLSFWLPTTYSAAASPVAALFSIMTKVGIYLVLRLWLLLFGAGSGASAYFGGDWLLLGGMATIAFGVIGVLASQRLGWLAAYCVLVSTGTVLAAIAIGGIGVTGSALFYLVSSTLALGAFFMLIELVERGREPGADVIAVTREVFSDVDEEDLDEPDEIGVTIPATMAVMGIAFLSCALLLAGLPPLSGFIAKFALLAALLDPAAVAPASWAFLALVIASGLATLIAMTRGGMRVFWSSSDRAVPRVRVIEMAPVAALLCVCTVLTIEAGPVMSYMQAASRSVHQPDDYVQSVLAAPGEHAPDSRSGS
ncbi:MAG TPA: monovalent cation/H+ antiporter subunit D [Gammaproteobacteria bacterium]|nr:monovalent cation/H+ antiporter subunit D [Gammaproteobacteria bacterium]